LEEYGKVYWHEAHHIALELELYEYMDVLEFVEEHELSKEALRMDTLIIKKVKDVQIKKNIGRIFKGHNIVEYKSEKDSFSYWDYQKVMGYAFIYSAFEKVEISDITISISLTMFPLELVKTLENERGLNVESIGSGIYHIKDEIIPVQILESKNLPEDENLFLHNLRSNLSSKAMFKTLQVCKERDVLDYKNVFLSRLVKANHEAYKEAVDMFSEDLREIIMAGAERGGWLIDAYRKRELETAKQIAKNMLLLGLPVEKVAKATELPLETVMSLANELGKMPDAC